MSTALKNEQPNVFPEANVRDLVELFKLLWSKKWIIMGASFTIAVITALISLQMPNIYRSTTTLLPVSEEQSSLSQYASLAAMAGVSLPSQGGTDVEKIMAVLKSRTIKERIINDLDLTYRLIEEEDEPITSLYMAILVFSDKYNVSQDTRSGLITISFEDEEPLLATEIVNYTVEVLNKVLNEKSLTISSKRLLLTEKQLADKRAHLEQLKNRLLDFQRRTQVLEPETQAQGYMELYKTLVQQKIALQVELETLRGALSESNPKIKTKEQQLEAIQYQLDNISTITSGGEFDAKDVPENMAEYTEISAELELAQQMYLSVFTQWEQLKLQEQKKQLYVEVIDKAIVPQIKIRPSRSKIVVFVQAIYFILVIYIFYLRKVRNREE